MNSLVSPDERCLVVVAAAFEARAIIAGFGANTSIPDSWSVRALGPRFDLLVSGVGKSNAAGATVRALAQQTYRTVLNMGICGGFPASPELSIGQTVLATACVFGDEGIDLGTRWMPLSQAGFQAAITGESLAPSEDCLAFLRPFADRAGPIVTVSSCSGNDAAATEMLRRVPGALAEAMEGAAVGLAAQRAGARFAEWRVVSNRTGDRDRQGWDIPKAASKLEQLAARLARM